MTVPISHEVMYDIAQKNMKLLGNISVEFLRYVEKNLHILHDEFKIDIKTRPNTHSRFFSILAGVQKLFSKFLTLHWERDYAELLLYSNDICEKLCRYFETYENIDEIWGLAEYFIEALQKKILDGTVHIQSNKDSWDPNTSAENIVLREQKGILITRILFNQILSENFCQISSLNVLKALDSAGYLITDTENSGRKHYKKKACYTV